MSVVIVALPSEDDKVFKISSEKIPHLTLCYLGETVSTEDTINIVQYVEHAASELSPFGMTVDYRGTLGPDNADVLFFENGPGDAKRIKDFRHYLLLNDTIKRVYDSVEQYPEWTPHLTLGYPTSPAKPDESDYPGINYVQFDRIAVWTGDFDGPEFRLKYEDYPMEVAMSDSTTAMTGANAIRELFHSGVKGMKWGVRKDKGHEGEQVKTKKLGKLDKQWEKENTGLHGYIKVNNKVADRMNGPNGLIAKHNDDPRWKDVDLTKPENSALEKTYMDEFYKMSDKVFAEETVKLGGNPSGSKNYEMREDADGNPYGYLAPVSKDIKHAAGDTQNVLKLNRNANGLVTSVTQTELVLKHYGVKGMRWGVTTVDKAGAVTLTSEKKSLRNTKPVTVSQRKAGTFVQAKGGQRHKATDDAVKAAAARQKAKKSTTDALTNDELRAANERMQLEQKYHQLNAKTKRRGESFVAKLFQSPETRKIGEDLAKRVAQQVGS